MLISLRKLATALGAVAILACSSPSYALPFTSGSFAMFTFTSTTTDVDTTTAFVLTSDVIAGSGAGDFAVNPPPVSLMAPASLDFVAPAGFNWSNPAIGTFTAAASAPLASAVGVSSWNVTGSFVPGAAWDNAGAVLTANMIWSATQTGGPGEAISLSGTFHAPAVGIPVPEPASLLMLGAGFFGLGLVLRRRQRTEV